MFYIIYANSKLLAYHRLQIAHAGPKSKIADVTSFPLKYLYIHSGMEISY